MNRSDASFIAIGHRGARGHAPENTLLSIDIAIQMGAQMVEFDVQLHPSGALLLLHDLRLERTTTGSGRLEEKSLEYLLDLDAGQGQRIPSLHEALDLVDQRVAVNVELKTANGTAEAVAQALRGYIADGWPADKFMVSSFHLPELDAFRQAAPEIPVGVLLCGVPLDWAACATELGATALSVSDEFADEGLIADAQARGLKVFVYTVNHVDEIARFKRLGVNGVFSDFPERVLGVRSAQPFR
jgi:glycerophosphoryl diester phosphodiesterase